MRHNGATRALQHPGMDTNRRVPLGVGVALAVAGLVVLAGCAGLRAADCGPDWHAVGQRDGRLGASPQAEIYARRCGVEVDTANYLRGWQEGFGMRPRPTV